MKRSPPSEGPTNRRQSGGPAAGSDESAGVESERPSIETVRRFGYGLFAMARPAFLLGTVPLYLVGAAAAYRAGYGLRVPAAVVGLATVWAVQAMTHYNNEYWDEGVDAAAEAPTRVTGGSRVLVDRIVPRRTARVAAVGSLGIALGLTAVAVRLFGADATFAHLVVVAALGGWFYSSPPVRLVGRGLGEVAVAVITGFLVPAVGYLLQASTIDAALGRAALPLLPLAFATSVATALPDIDGDRSGGKLTLPAHVGRPRAVVLNALALLVGWTLFSYVAVHLHPIYGPLATAAFLAPLVAFAWFAPTAAHGSVAAAEHVAVATLTTLGWASVSMVVLLLLA